MLAALDAALANISKTLEEHRLWRSTILVLSSDNGGMSGTYGMACCKCGTFCGGLNYPFRGYKDSNWEGGLRAIGLIYAPAFLARPGRSYTPLVWVGDWFRTLTFGAALASDGPAAAAAARRRLDPLLRSGLIDSVTRSAVIRPLSCLILCQLACPSSSHTSHAFLMLAVVMAFGQPADGAADPNDDEENEAAMASGQRPPRTETLLAGVDARVAGRAGAAPRGAHDGALQTGFGVGDSQWCDLNRSGFSPGYPFQASIEVAVARVQPGSCGIPWRSLTPTTSRALPSELPWSSW